MSFLAQLCHKLAKGAQQKNNKKNLKDQNNRSLGHRDFTMRTKKTNSLAAPTQPVRPSCFWSYSPMVTAAQPFNASQQCGYLILQLARFMWCEWGLQFRLISDMEIVCSLILLRSQHIEWDEDKILQSIGPGSQLFQQEWHTRTRRCDGKTSLFITPLHTSRQYHVSINSNPNVRYLWYTREMTAAWQYVTASYKVYKWVCLK